MIWHLWGWELACRRVVPAERTFELEVSLLCNDGSRLHPRPVPFRVEQRGRVPQLWVIHDGPGEVWKLCQHERRSVIGVEVRFPLRYWGFAEDKYVRISGGLEPLVENGKEAEWATYRVSLGSFILF